MRGREVSQRTMCQRKKCEEAISEESNAVTVVKVSKQVRCSFLEWICKQG